MATKRTTKTSATKAENKPVNTPAKGTRKPIEGNGAQAPKSPTMVSITIDDLPNLSIPVLADLLFNTIANLANNDSPTITIHKDTILPIVEAIHDKSMTSMCHYANCPLWRKAQLAYYAQGIVNRLIVGASKQDSPVTIDEAQLLSEMLKNDYTKETLNAFFGGK